MTAGSDTDYCAELEHTLAQLHPDWKLVRGPAGVEVVDKSGTRQLGPGPCRAVLDQLRPEITALLRGNQDT